MDIYIKGLLQLKRNARIDDNNTYYLRYKNSSQRTQ